MESFIEKLSAIETAASKIMENAIHETKLQDQAVEERTAHLDAQLEADACQKLKNMQKQLQDDSEKALEELKIHMEQKLRYMEENYQKNHQHIADEIYQQIIRM